MWDLKNDTNELIYKTEIQSQMQKTNLQLPGGKKGGRIKWEIGIDMYTLLCIKQITNENLYSTGNSPVMTYMGKESKKSVDICICITDSLCCTPETNTTL